MCVVNKAYLCSKITLIHPVLSNSLGNILILEHDFLPKGQHCHEKILFIDSFASWRSPQPRDSPITSFTVNLEFGHFSCKIVMLSTKRGFLRESMLELDSSQDPSG